MNKRLPLMVLILVIILSAKTIIAFGQLDTASINAILQKEIAGKRSKSIIVRIIDSTGKYIISAGKLSDDNSQLPDSNTIYEIGSVTKVFTSLLLVEMSFKKKLNLNDPISKFLPDYVKAPIRNGKEITLLTLSTHTSGLPRLPNNMNPKDLDNPFADYTVNELYEYISNFQLSRDIGSQFQYSNIGYGLLGHILTLVAGKDFESLIKQEICTPLQMCSTGISLTPDMERNMAMGFSEYGNPVSNWDLPTLAGTGALRSNMNDLLTFAAANLGFIKTELFPAMELSHIQQAKKDGNDGFVTMGWTLWNDNGKQILWKDGASGGYHSFIGLDMVKKTGIVILSNSFNAINDIAFHLLDSTRAINPYKYKWELLDTINSIIKSKGVDAAIKLYHQVKASNKPQFIFNEQQLNYVGYDLRQANKMKEAIRIYQLNVNEYPKSSLVYESLGETYFRNGNKKLAIENYKKSVALDSQNAHGIWMLKKLIHTIKL